MIPRNELISLVRAVITAVDNNYKGIQTNYDNVIDITYYRDKRNALSGKYNFTNGMVMLADGSNFIWDKHYREG